MENNKNMIITVPFSELKIWDVKSFYHQSDIFNKKYPVVLFGEFLTKPIISKVQIEDTKEYKILGARAYGKGAFVNRTVKGDTLKMRTYQQAKPNHLFWCKVDTKNGAFGIITEELADGVASSNMTFAKIETEKANPEFLQLLFKSKRINEYMDGYVSGTTNRKYIKPDQLRDEINIVLPPIEEQNRIVNNYKTKIDLAEKQINEANNLEIEIEKYLFDLIGVKKFEKKEIKKGLQIVNYSEISDWSMNNLEFSLWKSNKYPVTSIDLSKNLAIEIYRGKSPKYDINGKSYILNQKCNRWNFIDLKFKKTVSDNWFKSIDKDFLTREGDILINSTGEGTIGRASYINSNNEGLLYDSHLLMLRLNPKEVNPKYFTFLFNSSYGQSQVENIKSAQTTKQTELGVTNLKKIIFPIPPVEKQIEIVDFIENLDFKIRKLKVDSINNNDNALIEFENEIFNS